MAAAAVEQTLAHADRELLAQILDETGVERSLPDPSWSEYMGEALRTLAAWLGEPIQRFSSGRPHWLQLAAWGVLAALVIAIVLLLTRWLRRNLGRRSASPAAPLIAAAKPEAEPRTTRDRGTWRAEVERRLTSGQVDAALEAVWWWLARSLLAQDVDAAWTSRELLAAANRRELSHLAATLDRMAYGPTRPTVPDVRGFVDRIEAALA